MKLTHPFVVSPFVVSPFEQFVTSQKRRMKLKTDLSPTLIAPMVKHSLQAFWSGEASSFVSISHKHKKAPLYS